MGIDFPPLLNPGFHSLTLERLYQFTVVDPRFRLSRTRAAIMARLWTLVACLCRWQVGTELCVDGSFLTEKIDPRDVDVVLILPSGFEQNASAQQLAIWEWWDDAADEPSTLFSCHTFSVSQTNPDDPDHSIHQAQAQYWQQFFGTSRDGEKKGIGRILLPDWRV